MSYISPTIATENDFKNNYERISMKAYERTWSPIQIPSKWLNENIDEILMHESNWQFIKFLETDGQTLANIYSRAIEMKISFIPSKLIKSITDKQDIFVHKFPQYIVWKMSTSYLTEEQLIKWKKYVLWSHVRHSTLSKKVLTECKNFIEWNRVKWCYQNCSECHYYGEFLYD